MLTTIVEDKFMSAKYTISTEIKNRKLQEFSMLNPNDSFKAMQDYKRWEENEETRLYNLEMRANGKRNKIIAIVLSALVVVLALVVGVVIHQSSNKVIGPITNSKSATPAKSSSSVDQSSSKSTSSGSAADMPYKVDMPKAITSKSEVLVFKQEIDDRYTPEIINIVGTPSSNGYTMQVVEKRFNHDLAPENYRYNVTFKNITTKTIEILNAKDKGNRSVMVNTKIVVGKYLGGSGVDPGYSGQSFYVFPNKWGTLSVLATRFDDNGNLENGGVMQEFVQN